MSTDQSLQAIANELRKIRRALERLSPPPKDPDPPKPRRVTVL